MRKRITVPLHELIELTVVNTEADHAVRLKRPKD